MTRPQPVDGAQRLATGESDQPTEESGHLHRDLPVGLDEDELREYLRRTLAGAGPRPREGASATVTVTEAAVERTRTDLRRLAGTPGLSDAITIAATSLEVSLQDLLQHTRRRDRPVTVDLDVFDVALVTYARLETTADASSALHSGRGELRTRSQLSAAGD